MTTQALAQPVARQSFDDWMIAVDRIVWKTAGCSVHDCADIAFRDMYDDGRKPAAAARKAIRSTMEG